MYDVIAYHSSLGSTVIKVDDSHKHTFYTVNSQFNIITQSFTMGLPQQPVQPADDGASSSSAPTRANELPPAAIELAGKLFDFARQGKADELAQYISA
jgi:hypothetical protein